MHGLSPANSRPQCFQCGCQEPGYDTLTPRRFEFVPTGGSATLSRIRPRFEVGNGLDRPATAGDYDVIDVTGSLPVYTDHFEKRLAVCGRVFLIVGQLPVMEAMLVTRVGARELAREGLFETDLPPLRGAPTPKRFVF